MVLLYKRRKGEMIMKVYKLKAYGKTYNVTLLKGRYGNNNTLAVEMMLVNGKGKITEPWSMLTVNIDDSDVLASETMAFVDINNNGREISQWLVDNDIAEITWLTGSSGWCTYPLFAFKQEALNEMGTIE